jgi:hypothetical protein
LAPAAPPHSARRVSGVTGAGGGDGGGAGLVVTSTRTEEEGCGFSSSLPSLPALHVSSESSFHESSSSTAEDGVRKCSGPCLHGRHP